MTCKNIQNAQHVLYDHFLCSIQTESIDSVLTTFRRLFVDCTESSTDSELPVALYSIVIANSEQQFLFTLKRVCYILINNWGIQRRPDAIRALIQLFDERLLARPGKSLILKRLHSWLQTFLTSQDFQDLKLFAARYDHQDHWSNRYTSYLLAPQYLDRDNPLEQREAARSLSLQLKAKFRCDLAMYTAKSQTESLATTIDNPTVLGKAAINLVKMLLVKPGWFGYENLAHLFRQQCTQITYWNFKRALLHYMAYALPKSPLTRRFKAKLPEAVLPMYGHRDTALVTDALILRTCKRLVDSLTSEDGDNPSKFFRLFLARGNPMILVILLLKIALFCPNVQSHLELRMASLIRHYQTYSEEDCQWVINFFEVFRVTFAVYASGTIYNLVQVSDGNQTASDLDSYRIFSQFRGHHIDVDPTAPGMNQNLSAAEPKARPQLSTKLTALAPRSAMAS